MGWVLIYGMDVILWDGCYFMGWMFFMGWMLFDARDVILHAKCMCPVVTSLSFVNHLSYVCTVKPL